MPFQGHDEVEREPGGRVARARLRGLRRRRRGPRDVHLHRVAHRVSARGTEWDSKSWTRAPVGNSGDERTRVSTKLKGLTERALMTVVSGTRIFMFRPPLRAKAATPPRARTYT